MSSREPHSAEAPLEPLTRREHEILALLARGLSGPEIALKLSLARSSVKWYLHQVYAKLDVNSKQHAIRRATELGLLGAPGASAEPTPARADAPGLRHNLPVQATRFFGREREVAQLRARLSQNRLVTLTGSGGVGKTRLSLQTAEALLLNFADGVWLVELAPLTDPALAPQQVAASLGLRNGAQRPVLETLTAFLRDRQALLVLDNCEHVLGACAHLADALLRGCPRLRLLASSREPLGLDGEAVFVVPSLPFPDPDHLPPLEQMADYTAVGLFLDRARLVLPEYQVTAANAAALARICQRLDGIPLALEMAASRLRVLNTEALAARLDDVFRLLTGGSRRAPPRQQTLRALIDWSYDLLSPDDRWLFQRLAVFAGGFTLEAAEAVCAGDDSAAGPASAAALAGVETTAPPPLPVIDGLTSLVEKSLVVADRQPGQAPRFRLQEVMRQYAGEKLHAAGEAACLQARHRDYFLRFTHAHYPKLQTREQAVWSRKLLVERDNLRLALEWSFSDQSDVEAGPRMLSEMVYGPWASYQEQLDWYRRGLAWCQSHPAIAVRLQVNLLEYVSALVARNDPHTALACSQQAVALSRGLGHAGQEILMWNLLQLARVCSTELDDTERAAASMAEAEAILPALGPNRYGPEEGLRVQALFALERARLANQRGCYAEAQQQAGDSIRLYEASGSRLFANMGHMSLGVACLNLGAYAQAREHFLVALDLLHEAKIWWLWDDVYVLRCLALVDTRQEQMGRALEYGQECLRQADRIADRNIMASGLGVCAAIAAQTGQPARAARLAGAAQALYAQQGRKPWEDSSLDTLLPGWRTGPDAAALSDAFEAGQSMPAEPALAYALNGAAD